MTAIPRYVDPWTSPLYLHVGDRARNETGLVVEWDGSRGVPVCEPCDLAMTEWTATAERCCPRCGATETEPVAT